MPFVALAIGAALAALDQFFKYLVVNNLQPDGSVNVIGDFFKLTYVENKGVAFGMFEGLQWPIIVLTVILLAVIVIYMFRNKPEGKFFYITAALIIGGGVGNLIDRIVYRFVIDYLSFSIFPPVCNFADYCIVIGVIMLAVYLLFMTDKKPVNAVKAGDKEAENKETEDKEAENDEA